MNIHWCILQIHTSECVAHRHFHSHNLFLRRFFDYTYIINGKKHFFLYFDILWSILKNHAFEYIFYSCWLISNITPLDSATHLLIFALFMKKMFLLIFFSLLFNFNVTYDITYAQYILLKEEYHMYWGRPPILRPYKVSRLLPTRK